MISKHKKTLALLFAVLLLLAFSPGAYSQDASGLEGASAQPDSAVDAKAQEGEIVFDQLGNLLPKHFDERTQRSIIAGLDFLARSQARDGSFRNSKDGATYPISMTGLAGMAFIAGGNTTSRGPYAENVKRAVNYILSQADPKTGLISAEVEGRKSMYAHGFSMLFLASVYGMESDEAIRARMKGVIENGIKLIGSAQSNLGGWFYTPNSGDEGSVTVTQLQALRAAHNAGFVVPEDVVQEAIQYLELCRTPDGGIRYSFRSSNQTRLPISAAALVCFYSAGEYESDMAEDCLEYVFRSYCLEGNDKTFNKQGGFTYYGHYYAAQAFYQAGDKYWDAYFPVARDQLLQLQGQGGEGAWTNGSVGPVYGTALALTILQLPYKYLPIYQR